MGIRGKRKAERGREEEEWEGEKRGRESVQRGGGEEIRNGEEERRE